jgi:hypothetical protein
MRPIAALPPVMKPGIEKFDAIASAGLFAVHEMTILAGRVWFIAEGVEKTNIESVNKKLSKELYPARSQEIRLFSYDPGGGKLEPVTAVRQFRPVGLFAHEDQLWMGLGRDGVAVLNPGTGFLRRFGKEEGLNVETAYRFAYAGGRVFVTANMLDLFAWDAAAQRWSVWKYPNDKGPQFAGEIRRLCGSKSQLFLYHAPVHICDVPSGKWTEIETVKPDMRYNSIGCVCSDSDGFWFGGREGLYFLNPQNAEVVNWFRPMNAMPPGQTISTPDAVKEFVERRGRREERMHRPAFGRSNRPPASTASFPQSHPMAISSGW